MAVEISNEEELDMVDMHGRAPRSTNPRAAHAEGIYTHTLTYG